MITLYKCPTCEDVSTVGGSCAGFFSASRYHVPVELREFRVFGEEDIRPLWETFRFYTRDLSEGDDSDVDQVREMDVPAEWKDTT